MDPLTAALNVVNGINTIINTLLSKASSAEIDKLIQVHVDARTKWENFIERIGDHLFPPSKSN